MTLQNVGLIAIDSSRTRAYLDALTQNDLLPAHVIYLTGGPGKKKGIFSTVPYFDNLTPALDKVRALELPCNVIDTGDINSDEVRAAVEACPVNVLIYSGPGGAILRHDILNTGKQFLHLHPGIVPKFRGSTTVYYSLLSEENCGVSAIFLDEEIDTGPVLATRAYHPPADRRMLDYGYDPYIRSDLLVRVLREYQKIGEFITRSQTSDGGENYFIMHPVLRHITILSNRET